jgi:hypothetical protein
VKAAEVAERLNLRDYRPTVLKDPISHWIEADCWNPPSLPNHTFNSLKTFCGPVGFRKSANNADSKRGTSALWFSRHRRGGDAMLHHRTLNPVVIRDWSTKMETFTSALALTADTSTASHKSLNLDRPRSPAEFTAYSRTHWFRPQPRPSDCSTTRPSRSPGPNAKAVSVPPPAAAQRCPARNGSMPSYPSNRTR